jgi:hypothetical protein
MSLPAGGWSYLALPLLAVDIEKERDASSQRGEDGYGKREADVDVVRKGIAEEKSEGVESDEAGGADSREKDVVAGGIESREGDVVAVKNIETGTEKDALYGDLAVDFFEVDVFFPGAQGLVIRDRSVGGYCGQWSK